MEKSFFEVFQGFEAPEEQKKILSQTGVRRVALNKEKKELRVYLQSPRWLDKNLIFGLERQLSDHCFPGMGMKVKIIEHFRLSRQYTPELFLKDYQESMEAELKAVSLLEYNLFHRAKLTFPEPDLLHIQMADSIIAREKLQDLTEYIE